MSDQHAANASRGGRFTSSRSSHCAGCKGAAPAGEPLARLAARPSIGSSSARSCLIQTSHRTPTTVSSALSPASVPGRTRGRRRRRACRKCACARREQTASSPRGYGRCADDGRLAQPRKPNGGTCPVPIGTPTAAGSREVSRSPPGSSRPLGSLRPVGPAGACDGVDDGFANLRPAKLVPALVCASLGAVGSEPGDDVEVLEADLLPSKPRSGEAEAVQIELGVALRLQADAGG